MPALPSLSDIKVYLGLTTTGDDALLTQLQGVAVGRAEADTGRSFSSSSNQTTRYSTDWQFSLVIHDRPFTDASRTVQLNGVTMSEGSNVWFLPDRRDQNITTTIQLQYYDTSRSEWYKADPGWFDKNLDRPRRGYGSMPNDLVISGIKGQPFPRSEVTGAITILWAWLYWRAKSGASGTVATITGDLISLSDLPVEYQQFVTEWRIRTAVSSIG